MMRIITGKARGMHLDTLAGDNTRPTGEKAKMAMFSAVQFELEGRRALDLFAGSAQLGLEALSRGGASCMFVDSSPEAMEIIKKNCKKTGFFDLSNFLISDYRNYIRKAGGKYDFDLIFIDPPYAMNCAADAVKRIVDEKLATEGALFIIEYGDEDVFAGLGAYLEKFDIVKEGHYGRENVKILRYKGEKQ